MTFIFSTPSLVFMGDEARKGLGEVFWCADKLLETGWIIPHSVQASMSFTLIVVLSTQNPKGGIPPNPHP